MAWTSLPRTSSVRSSPPSASYAVASAARSLRLRASGFGPGSCRGRAVSHAHLRYLRPFPKNLGEMLRNFEQVLVPEINNGQLIRIIRDQFLIDAKPYNKIMGVPITKTEMIEEIRKILSVAVA